MPIDPNFKRPLGLGINYIGYMGINPESADDYLADLIGPMGGPHSLVVAQTFGNSVPGFTQNYVPDGGSANTLTQFENGRGYIIIVNTAIGSSWRPAPGLSEIHDFIWGTVGGNAYVAGDEVEILNAAGELVGLLEPDNEGFFRATPLYGATYRADGSEVDGLEFNEEIRFRYNGQTIAPGLHFNGSWMVTELNLNFTELTPTTSGQEGIEAEEFTINIAPNPVGDVATITLFNPSVGQVELLIMDVNGRVAQRLLSTDQLSVGTTRFDWSTVADLPSGIYNLIAIKDGRLIEAASQRIIKQ